MIAIIDADSILYRACHNVKTLDQATVKYLDIAKEYITTTWADKAVCYVKGEGNWRYDVFKYYKAQRSHNKALFLRQYGMNVDMIPVLIDWLVEHKFVIRANGMEADDLVRRRAVKCVDRGQNFTIISADKDLDCIAGKHIRPYKSTLNEYTITQEEADYNYYKQIMIGDEVDYIKSPRLLGPKTADKLLNSTPRGQWKSMIEREYKERCGKEWLHALMFTGSLIHIQRYKDDFFVWDKNKGNFWECGFKEAPACYGYKIDELEAKARQNEMS